MINIKVGAIIIAGLLLIFLFKKLGIKSLACGLLSGFLASILVNTAFFFVDGSISDLILSIIGFTALAMIGGFFASRKIYGLPGFFEDT